MKKVDVFFAVLIAAIPCLARIITVDDDGPADFSNIQAAIDDANDGDTVEIQPGTYTGPGNGDINFKGKAVTVCSTEPNDPNIVAATIISGAGRIFYAFRFFTEEDPNSVLDGLTIRTVARWGHRTIECYGASPTIRNCTFDFGSGPIYCTDASPIIEGCAFISCLGAIYCDSGSPTIERCTFTSCSGSYGGAIYCTNASPTIKDCIISSSSAEDWGGAIYCEEASSPTIDNCVFNTNSAQIGGAIYFLESTSQISRCTFRDNSATVSSGGAVRINESTVTIIDSIFEGNSAQTGGGGINSANDSELRLENCIFVGCTAPTGGALNNAGRNAAIASCLFVGNSASQTESQLFSTKGGALSSLNAGTTLSNCLFAGNSASIGGATFVAYRGMSIANCTFVGNRAALGRTLCNASYASVCKLYDCRPASIYIINTIIQDAQQTIVNTMEDSSITLAFCDVSGGQSSVHDPYDCVTWGPGNIDGDPCFADPGYWDANGTPEDANDDFWVDGDYHLKSQAGRWDTKDGRWATDDVTSPCVDAGDPMSPIGLEPFPNGGIINMGAYGGTAEASKSYFGKPPCETVVAGDVNGDCEVDFEDFRLMALHWLEARQ